MEIILADTIKNLGDEGQIVKVRDGYARNYLIPRGLAFPVNTSNAKEAAHRKRMLMDQRKRKIKTEQDLANRLSEVVIKIKAKAGEEDKLFGSVTTANIAEALANKGYNVDRRKIALDEPIKVLGMYTVNIRFSGETSAKLKVLVEKE